MNCNTNGGGFYVADAFSKEKLLGFLMELQHQWWRKGVIDATTNFSMEFFLYVV
jgi:hypothetical protein